MSNQNSRTTIYTELKRGTVIQIRQGKSKLVYLADAGQATYERQHVGSFNTIKIGAIGSFINWIESKTLADHWSFDAAVRYAKHKVLEFSEISNLENETLSIYFARPYSAWERGSNERHNGLLRRCIPKGMPIKAVSEETIQRTLQWCNNLPRKLLNYRTPLDVFLEEVNKIVDLDTVQFHIAI